MNVNFLKPTDWVISDTHFNHRMMEEWAVRKPGWQDTLIERWRSCVKPTDIVFHLGDVELGPASLMDEVAPLLTGLKVLMRGNHDQKKKDTKYRRWGFVPIAEYGETVSLDLDGCAIDFTHNPVDFLGEIHYWTLRVHGHIHKGGDHGFVERDGYVNVNPEFTGMQLTRVSALIEQARERRDTGSQGPAVPTNPCATCGHDSSLHRLVMKMSGSFLGPCQVGHPERCECDWFDEPQTQYEEGE